MGSQLWDNQIRELRVKTGADKNVETLLSATDLASVDVSKTIYQAVFTAHPVFSLNATNSNKLSEMAEGVFLNHFLRMPMIHEPKYLFKMSMTKRLQLSKVREAIMSLHKKILKEKCSEKFASWRDTVPKLFAVSTWVGYDLDGGQTLVGLIASDCVCLRKNKFGSLC